MKKHMEYGLIKVEIPEGMADQQFNEKVNADLEVMYRKCWADLLKSRETGYRPDEK